MAIDNKRLFMVRVWYLLKSLCCEGLYKFKTLFQINKASEAVLIGRRAEAISDWVGKMKFDPLNNIRTIKKEEVIGPKTGICLQTDLFYTLGHSIIQARFMHQCVI